MAPSTPSPPKECVEVHESSTLELGHLQVMHLGHAAELGRGHALGCRELSTESHHGAVPEHGRVRIPEHGGSAVEACAADGCTEAFVTELVCVGAPGGLTVPAVLAHASRVALAR